MKLAWTVATLHCIQGMPDRERGDRDGAPGLARSAALRGALHGGSVSAQKAVVSSRHTVAVSGHKRNRPKSGLIFEAKCDMMASVEGMS